MSKLSPSEELLASRDRCAKLVEALEALETANQNVAATRCHEVYNKMIESGQENELLELDQARRNARKAIEDFKASAPGVRA